MTNPTTPTPAVKPILFQTAMVQSILSGRKTQTRRIVKFSSYTNDDPPCADWIKSAVNIKGNIWKFTDQPNNDGNYAYAKCPYGKVGDILYVRETYLDEEDYACSDYDPEDPESGSRFSYKADCPEHQWPLVKWKPSLFMPKAAARLFLKITEIRIERLQDISEKDAKAEGIEVADRIQGHPLYRNYIRKGAVWNSAVNSYSTLWDAINGKDAWEQNPFVWVISFQPIDNPFQP